MGRGHPELTVILSMAFFVLYGKKHPAILKSWEKESALLKMAYARLKKQT